MATWPGTLPTAPLASAYEEHAPNLLLRSTVEQGPARVRRKCTAKPWRFPVSMVLSSDQVSTLDTFIYTTLEGGALRFDFTHPRTAASIECRFVPVSDADLFTIRRYGSTLSWEVSMQFEAMP